MMHLYYKVHIQMPPLISLAPISSLYLFSVTSRTTQSFIGKFGYTKDLHRRAREHKKVYGPAIELEAHASIEPLYLREAERKLVRFFKGNDMCIRPHSIPGMELVLIHHSDLHDVLVEYSRIGQEYSELGSYTTLYGPSESSKSFEPLNVFRRF